MSKAKKLLITFCVCLGLVLIFMIYANIKDAVWKKGFETADIGTHHESVKDIDDMTDEEWELMGGKPNE